MMKSFKMLKLLTVPSGSTILRSNLNTAANLTFSENKQSTVDSSDIEKHAKLSNEWWDLNGPMKALHSYNHLRVPFIRDGLIGIQSDKIANPLKDFKILDVGCGGGILSEPLARIGAKVTGIDAGKKVIDLAIEHSSNNQNLISNPPEYICSSIEDHVKERKEYYDGVVASEVIEHVDNKELFVKSCVESLKPGGRIFFTTPTRTRISQFAGIFIAEYVLRIVPKGTHQYDKFMTPPELSFLLERNNCHVEAIYGMTYHVWSNKWQWINNTSLLFALQAVKT